MLTELHRKGGCLCQPAKEGKLRCPLIIRPTSEDVITGHLFQALKILNPRWWLPDLLNEALGVTCFRRQVYRALKIELWQNRPCYPRELLPWDEGSTQVDASITWENPPRHRPASPDWTGTSDWHLATCYLSQHEVRSASLKPSSGPAIKRKKPT